MATYKAVEVFADLEDGKHLYKAGDVFPRPGKEVPKSRIAELSGTDNKMHRPLIAEDVSVALGGSQKKKTGESPTKAAKAKGKPRKGQEKA